MPTGHNDDQPEALYPTSGRRIGTGLEGEPDTPARDASMATARERRGWPAETEPVRFVSPAGSVAITHFGESPAEEIRWQCLPTQLLSSKFCPCSGLSV